MGRFDIVTIGGAVKDFTFYTDVGKFFSTPENLTAQRMLAFEFGAKINIKESYRNLGGGAANAAVCLSRLGFKVAIVSRLGRDEIAKEIVANFKNERISNTLIQTDKKLPSGYSFILAIDKKEREHISFSFRGAENNLEFSERSAAKLRSDWIYLTSLSGKGWLKTLRAIFYFAARKNIKIAWNPGNLQLQGGKKILSPFLKQTDILILNKDEAIELVLSGVKLGKKNPKFFNKPLFLLNILDEWGPKITLLTCGKQGAWVYKGKKIYRINIINKKVIDTTGVGDSFGSSFLAGLIANKNDIKLALKWGVINSGSVVSKVGAQNGLLPKKKLVEKL